MGGGQQTPSTGVIGFVPLCLCVRRSRCIVVKELLKFLGLIHLVPVKLTSEIVFLLSLVLVCLEFCHVSGPLGKMSSVGGLS